MTDLQSVEVLREHEEVHDVLAGGPTDIRRKLHNALPAVTPQQAKDGQRLYQQEKKEANRT
jgi:hypothetical protein